MIVLLFVGWAQAATTVLVHRGDTVAGLAARWGVTETDVRLLNQLPTGEPKVGSVLTLPPLPGEFADAALIHRTGTVDVRPPGAAEHPGEEGEALAIGAVVCTGEDGFATIRLASMGVGLPHDEVSLLPGTCLTIDVAAAANGHRTAQVSVAQGSVNVRDATDSAGEVAIRTAAGVSAGSGGGFRVTVEPAAARTEALSDPVAVIGAGEQLDLPPAHGSRTRTGEVPGAMVPLLPEPSLQSPTAGVALDHARFGWQAENGAVGYRFEVGTDADFSATEYVDLTAPAAYRPPLFELPTDEGRWYWRVEGVDADGFVGMPSAARCFTAPPGVVPAAAALRCAP